MRGVIITIAACGLLIQGALAQQGIELSLSRAECEPGDVIELHARMKRPGFSEYEINLPKSDSLRVIARKDVPVRYEDGFYSQETTWVLQPVTSGVIEVKGIKGRFLHGGEEGVFELPAQTLTVRSYGETEDSFAPEPLPAVESEEARMPYLTIVLVGIVLALILVFRRRKCMEDAAPVVKVTLGDLRAALEAGEVPVLQIEDFLSDSEARISSGLRAVLESAVYGRGADRDALLDALRKEGQA